MLNLVHFAFHGDTKDNLMVAFSWVWYNGSYTMAAKPIKSQELHYTMIHFFNNSQHTIPTKLKCGKGGHQRGISCLFPKKKIISCFSVLGNGMIIPNSPCYLSSHIQPAQLSLLGFIIPKSGTLVFQEILFPYCSVRCSPPAWEFFSEASVIAGFRCHAIKIKNRKTFNK